MQPTITLDEAKQRAATYLQEIVGALPVRPRLEAHGLSPLSGECTDPDDHGPLGRYDYAIDYFLRDVPKERNPEVFEAFQRYLTHRGFTALSQGPTHLAFENPRDGFRAGIQESDSPSKALSLGVSSPCVWPNGTPPPR